MRSEKVSQRRGRQVRPGQVKGETSLGKGLPLVPLNFTCCLRLGHSTVLLIRGTKEIFSFSFKFSFLCLQEGVGRRAWESWKEEV